MHDDEAIVSKDVSNDKPWSEAVVDKNGDVVMSGNEASSEFSNKRTREPPAFGVEEKRAKAKADTDMNAVPAVAPVVQAKTAVSTAASKSGGGEKSGNQEIPAEFGTPRELGPFSETRTANLPWVGYVSMNNVDLLTPVVLNIRMNSPYPLLS